MIECFLAVIKYAFIFVIFYMFSHEIRNILKGIADLIEVKTKLMSVKRFSAVRPESKEKEGNDVGIN